MKLPPGLPGRFTTARSPLGLQLVRRAGGPTLLERPLKPARRRADARRDAQLEGAACRVLLRPTELVFMDLQQALRWAQEGCQKRCSNESTR